MLWNKNEGDILAQTLTAAVKKVDHLYLADDGSSDNSLEIMKKFQERFPQIIQNVQQSPTNTDPGQRQSLLDKIQKNYSETDWIQIIESDIVLLDTDPREAIEKHGVNNVAVCWQTLNAARRKWPKYLDTYPNWSMPLTELMPKAHLMEEMVYTFRNLKGLKYRSDKWRPWPTGFGTHLRESLRASRGDDAPLLLHYGFRGPTHFHLKYKNHGTFHKKHETWNVSSREKVLETVPFFNGTWNNKHMMDTSREGWIKWRRKRTSQI